MVSTIENESVTSGLKITFRYRIVHLLVASCTVSEGMRCGLWKYHYYIYLFCWSQVTCKKLTGWDATSWNCVVCSYRSVKANLLRVHVIWRHYSKWSPKHSSMKSVSNLSEGNLCYWKRKLLNTIFPKRKALGMNRNQICISWKQPAQECSQAPCCVCAQLHASCIRDQTQRLSSLHLTPPHPHCGLCKKVGGWWRKQDLWAPHKSSLGALGTASFIQSGYSNLCVCLIIREAKKNPTIQSKNFVQYRYPLQWKPHPQAVVHGQGSVHVWKVFTVFISAINEPCNVTEHELLLFWTTVMLQNHAALSPVLI